MSKIVSAEPTHGQTYLPAIRGMASGLRHGRNVYEGTQRGWGLQYGTLRQSVLQDPLYQEAVAAGIGRTIVAEENRMNIYLLLRFFLGTLPAGHIIEFGSYKGGNAIFMALVCQRLHPGTRVFALDTYEGMPPTDKTIDAHNTGDFADVLFDDLDAQVRSLHLDNLTLVRGRFEETAATVLRDAGAIRLAHVDCDIASAVSYSYEVVKPYMVDGGYIVFDDATVSSCLGATEVVEDLVIRRDGLNSEQIWPHFVFRHFTNS
jgi:predicted O-methyltransferase YrrM